MTASVFSPSREKRSTIAAMLGIATATPPVFSQEHVLPLAIRLASATPDQEAWIKRIYRNSGVRSRGTVLALGSEDFDALSSFYPSPASAEDRGPTTAQRMTKYAEYAPVLAESAVERAISNAAIDADELTHLITASCTGFFAPGLDAALIQRLGLPSQMQRQHIGFMGCHAAFNALAAARDAIANKPSARVLVCCVELCSLHFA
ncbi:MAG TPA: hypothetical protein VG722_05990, partial [Tepidisphaeraceae bacterium]|nr:hypothetical protein [Tepidisphaeraceae bacterium]